MRSESSTAPVDGELRPWIGQVVDATVHDGRIRLKDSSWHLVLVAVLAVPGALALVDWLGLAVFEVAPVLLVLPPVVLGLVVVGAIAIRGMKVRELALGQQAFVVVGTVMAGLMAGFVLLILFHLKLVLLVLRGLVRAILHGDGPDTGQIWWAQVPFDGGTDDLGRREKERPVLILKKLGTFRARYVVAPFTSQEKRRGQPGYVEVAAISRSKGTNFLNVRDTKVLPKRNFVRSTADSLPGRTRRQILRTARSELSVRYRF